MVLNNFLVPNASRIEAIKCFGEIAALLCPNEGANQSVLTNAPAPTDRGN